MSEPILTVVELRAALERWPDNAEVWALTPFGIGEFLFPAVGVRTFGPDSTGQRDGVCLEMRRRTKGEGS